MKFFKINCFIIYFACLSLYGSAQEVWSLEKCVNHAIEKSLQIEGSQLLLSGTEIDINQARHARYPNLSAGSNVGWNFGRTIDPTSNQFVTETFFNNSFSLNSNVLLYNGGRVGNTINQSIANNKATVKDLEQTKRDISLSVASLYLNILFAKENLQNAENQLVLTNEQLSQLNKQIAVGNRPENDRLDLEAQIATNEQTITEAKNNLTINLLNLKQLLRLDPDFNLDIVNPGDIPLETDPDIVTFNELYLSALGTQPSVAANEMRVKSAELGEKISKASFLPTLGAGGNLRTNYSNKGFNSTLVGTEYQNRTLLINNQEVKVGFPSPLFDFEKIPYFDQFTNNLSYGVGISLNIPVYNNYTSRAGLQRAQLNTERANLNLLQTRETLKITVGQALSDAKAAKAKFQATNKTKTAQSNLYNNAVKRFEIGNLNAFELTRLKTQLESASINNIIAKYDYLFRTKILDFYLGKPIKLTK
ncbi:MAG: TolC family protein [Saprospiraceae bacterium]|jgi:outer membrane protein|nr:TolC family protein [Saprospiraceae bacterium]